MKQNDLFLKALSSLKNNEFRDFQQNMDFYLSEINKENANNQKFSKLRFKNYKTLKKQLMNKLEVFQDDYHEYAIILKYIEKYLKQEDFNYYAFLKKVGENFKRLGKFDFAYDIFKSCLKTKDAHYDMLRLIGDVLYFNKKDSLNAITYYEKYIEFEKENASVYNILGCIYESLYKSKMLDKQMEYFEAAHRVNPQNRTYLKNLLIVTGKNNLMEKYKQYSEKLLKNNPTQDDYYDYACWSMHNKIFENMYKYFSCRFFKENDATEYPNIKDRLWDGKENISGKKLLVRYEQGFGDSIMFVRFLPILQKLHPKFVFMVQEPLFSLFKYNFPQIDMVSSSVKLENIDYDYQIPLMELFTVLKITDKNLPVTDKYISVSKELSQQFKQKYITSEKFKVGIAFKGTPSYGGDNRDIPVEIIAKISEIPNVQVYSLQVDNKKPLFDLPQSSNIIDLSPAFNNFEQTAAAVDNMDLIVSTDNVILNLAGAMGANTFGLFNCYTDYRWFTLNGYDTGWYKSIRAFRNKDFDAWEETFDEVLNEIKILSSK